MSITLTDRDTGTQVLTLAGATPDGVRFAVAGSSGADARSHQTRFSNVGGATGRSRSNLNSERRIRDANGKVWSLRINTTIDVENGHPFTNDQIDDELTAHNSYFSSEQDTADFVQGLSRQ